MTYEEIRKNPEVCALLRKGNENLGVLGFTDHSMTHCVLVAERAAHILKVLGYSEHEQELAKIAGVMHDIGNAINRKQHAEIGALQQILDSGQSGADTLVIGDDAAAVLCHGNIEIAAQQDLLAG